MPNLAFASPVVAPKQKSMKIINGELLSGKVKARTILKFH